MKSYIYIYERKASDRNGNPRHWITVYRVKRNVPEVVVQRTEVGYRSEMQSVIEELVKAKELPKGTENHHNAWTLERNKVARISAV